MREYKLYLEDIIISIEKIERYSSKNIKKEDMALDAVLRNLEIIGEAIKNIPNELKDKHKEIEWKKISGMRDIISHAYFGIDKDIILDIIVKKLPALKTAITNLINES